jgi:lysophospholipase L1-like esterase
MNLVFKAKDVIEFIGDSITDADHLNTSCEPYGHGYVRYVHHLLQTGYPELRLHVLNKGVSGDCVTNLKNRWKIDVLDINPNWLFIYIGINDVWRYFEGNREEAVALPEFENTYRQLINGARANTQAQIRLVSPFLAEKNPSDSFRARLCSYQDAIDNLGKGFNIPVVHLQPAFDWAMLSEPSNYWTNDRVHPTEVGHMLIAVTILRTCGYRL